MSTINSILSGLIDPLAGYGRQATGQSAPPADAARAAGRRDVFVRGEWWANQAAAREEGGVGLRQCSCGQCPQCATRAYRRQQGEGGETVQGDGKATPSSAATTNVASPGDESEKMAEREGESTPQANTKKPDGTALSDEELREVSLLQKIDTKVRAHEMAHVAVAGAYARGGASFQYKRGPDGRNYAVGGEVPIDVAKEATPQATINKMQVVKAAALAPADPSPQDRKVASAAVAAMGEARQQLRLQELAELANRQEQSTVAKVDSSGPQEADGVAGAQEVTAGPGAEEKGRRRLIGNYFNPQPEAGRSIEGFATVV